MEPVEEKVADEVVVAEPVTEAPKEEVKEEVKKEEFAEDEFVTKNKYNQALRKLREMELEKIDLAKKVAPIERPVAKATPTPVAKPQEKSFWDGDEEEEKTPAPIEPTFDEETVTRLVDERIKPIFDAQKEAHEKQKKNDRTIFFEKNPKYLNSSESWQDLVDEMNRSINPNSGDSYFEQLEKARILLESSTAVNRDAERFSKDVVADAANIAPKAGTKMPKADEITSDERKLMREYGISEEGMQAYKRKIQDGDMVLLGMK
jgi:hypothetical protein